MEMIAFFLPISYLCLDKQNKQFKIFYRMKLRNLLWGGLVCCALAIFSSCEPEQKDLGNPALTVSVSELAFEEVGGDKAITLNATRDWRVTSNVDWVVVAPASGEASAEDQTVVVSALANTGGNRTATLTFTIGMVTKTVSVTQTGSGASAPEIGITPIADVLKATSALVEGTVIKGIVISNMGLNNLTSKKGMYVQDGTAGLQFYLAANHSFEVGTEVKIDLSGVTLGAYNGAVQISNLALDKITQVSTGNALEVKTVTMADYLANKYEGQYIAIEGVQVVSADLNKTWVVGEAHTSINMEDANGNKFVVFSSKYATYGASTVAQGSGTIKGISSINNGNMQIIFAQESDYAGLTGARFEGAVVTPPAGDDDNTGDDNTGGAPTPPTGDVTGTTLSITKETINNPSWTTNNYGSQATATLDTYLNWTINGCNFIGCKMCIPNNTFADVAMQCQGNASDAAKQFRLGNTTSLGKIKQITIVSYNESYTPNFNLAIGTTQQVGTTVPNNMIAASAMTTTQDGQKYTTVYTPTTDAGFFAIYKNTTGALYLNEIVVVYELN